MQDALTSRAAGRVMLACRALAAAVDDLAAARRRYGASGNPIGEVESQRERICELAEQLLSDTERFHASAAAPPTEMAAGRKSASRPTRRPARRAAPRSRRTARSSRSASG